MIRPVFYKSFRSRNFNQLEETNRSLDLTNLSQKNLVIDIGFGTGESTIALSVCLLMILFVELNVINQV